MEEKIHHSLENQKKCWHGVIWYIRVLLFRNNPPPLWMHMCVCLHVCVRANRLRVAERCLTPPPSLSLPAQVLVERGRGIYTPQPSDCKCFGGVHPSTKKSGEPPPNKRPAGTIPGHWFRGPRGGGHLFGHGTPLGQGSLIWGVYIGCQNGNEMVT